MAITRPASSVSTNFSNTTTTTVSLDAPADIAANDVAVWCITVQNNQVITDITDFTTMGKANGTALGSIVAYKVCTGSETTFSHTIGSARYASALVIFRGVDTTNVLDVTSPTPITEHDVGTDAPVMPEITTATDGALVIGVPAECMSNGAGAVDFTATNCDEMVGEITSNNGSGSNTGCVFLLETLATAGSFTPTVTCAVDPARNEGYTFALRPAVGGGGDDHTAPQDDSIGVTDSLLVTEKKSTTDSVGVTDSLATTEQKGKTDNLGVTDSRSITQSKSKTDSVGVTDSRFISLAKRFTDAIGITDELSFTKFKLSTETPTDPIDVTDELEKTYAKGFFEFLNTTDQIHIQQQKATADSVGVTDELTITKLSITSRTLEFLVGITDTIGITIKKVITNTLGLTDNMSVTGGSPGSEAEPMSLVDEKRIIIGSVLGIAEPDLSALSINDLLHRYWSADFPALHEYDGSESDFTPVAAFSTMDHHSRVESFEATDLDWIRGVVV